MNGLIIFFVFNQWVGFFCALSGYFIAGPPPAEAAPYVKRSKCGFYPVLWLGTARCLPD